MSSVLEELLAVLPSQVVSADDDVRAANAADVTGHLPGGPPAVVVFPETVEQVQTTLRVAHRLRVPVAVRGRGTGLAGGAAAPDAGIVLSTVRLNRIVSIDAVDQLAVVEPGVVTADLDRAAAEHGLRYAPDPASSEWSSIGGNIATNAGGLHCVKYGVTRESVLELEVVLADGSLLRTGHRTVKGVTGLDLVGLFVGSEGTLGVVVGAVVKLQPVPVATETLIAWADSTATAAAAVAAIMSSGGRPSVLELLDQATLQNIDGHSGTALAGQGDSLLLVQTDGWAADREADALLAVLAAAGADARKLSADEAETYVELRRSGRGPRPDLWTIGEDVAVPRSRLVEMIRTIEAIGQRHGLLVASVAHAGDGNLHPALSVAKRPGETAPPEVLRIAADELVRAALAVGGTISGEHGIGALKREWLADELGEPQLDLQRRIKAVFDPLGILSPDSFLAVTEERQLVP
ncbi:FAD-binding oxidoreductase [Nakamurella alba]|uniref:FAD-binding oxidoreductase n=1 Tax=Nakamurella alba TaxID=2665158 RepID=UPI002AC371D9|nr:FAD-linked oxidase C-terminal domain-containing protein [Nakamurella alba]